MNKIDLSGSWKYILDESEMLNGKEVFKEGIYNDILNLPGTISSNKVGHKLHIASKKLTKENLNGLKQEFSYLGWVWYQKEVLIPREWDGKNIVLFLERVMFESEVWINGMKIGNNTSLSTPHKYKISKFIKFGVNNEIIIKINNKDVEEIGNYASGYTNETQTIWNGIVGEIALIKSEKLEFENIRIVSNSKKYTIELYGELYEEAVEKTALIFSVYGESNKFIAQKEVIIDKGERSVKINIKLRDIKFWNEFTPYLYKLNINYQDSNGIIKCNDFKFGIREFKTKDKQFMINNMKIFLRGTLDCCTYPLTGYPPMDKETWKNNMQVIKDYGLNHIRFHSWCPPKAAFEAADELGLYLNIEGPFWMDTWMGFKVGSKESHYKYIPKEAKNIIDTYGNHPSFCMLSLGNELNGDFKLLENTLIHLKEKRPDILYTCSTNFDRKLTPVEDYLAAGAANGIGIRGQHYLDDLTRGTMLNYNEAVKNSDKPILAHEVGQYSVYPDINEVDEYKGVLKPMNIEVIKKDLQDKDLIKYAKEYKLGSGRLAGILYKAEIEAALRTTAFGGFQLLGLHDFPGQGTATVGLLNAFGKSKGIINKEEFKEFCSHTVLLFETEKRILAPNDKLNGNILIANYSNYELKDIILNWKLVSGNKIIKKGEIQNIFVKQGELLKINNTEIDLEEVNIAHLKFIAEIKSMNLKNEWDIWKFQDEIVDKKDVTIVQEYNEEVITKLDKGEKILLLPKKETIKNGIKGNFVPVFWSPVFFLSKASLGIWCHNDNKIFKDFPTDRYVNYQWKNILENSCIMNIDILPKEFDPIVNVIPNFFNNSKATNLLEARVKKGKLVICTVQFDDNNMSVEETSLLNSILNYMNSNDFEPKQTLEAEQINGLFGKEEIKITSDVDLALNKTALSDSEKEKYKASKANDGNISTAWMANDEDSGHWWQVDLGKKYRVKKIKINFLEEINYLYVIYASNDGEEWDLVLNRTGQVETNKIREEELDIKARYIRLVFNGTSPVSKVGLVGFEVYGEEDKFKEI